jgi:thiol-disulfide isomerase/thioredoxin
VIVALGLFAGAAPAHAGQATCSNPGLPVGAAASSDLMPGRLTLGLTTALLPITNEQVLQEGASSIRYDATVMLVEARLSAEYAVTPWLALGVALPYRVVDVGVTYRDPTSGDEVPPGTAGIHARDETIRGVGDPSLAVHVARELGAYRLHARAGTSLPFGSTVEDPFALGHIGQEHEHIQLGTGTFVPFVAGELQRSAASVTGVVWGIANVSLYENSRGFRPSRRISGGLSASTGLGTRTWTFGAAAEVHAETAEKWHGMIYTDEGNAGRYDVLAGVDVAWRPMRGLAMIADVKLPVYEHVTGAQLDYGVVAGVGLVTTFDLAPRTSWHGLDEATLGAAGTAPGLAPVAGRITVFDLWAAWCGPCRELDAKLVALARRYPERIAVRKLDVVDNDSAAWTTYLAPGGFSLPHLKVYRDDGSLVFERTAPPDELVRAVEQALR